MNKPTGRSGAATHDAPKLDEVDDAVIRRRLLRRFWRTARGFWARKVGPAAWMMTGLLVVILAVQIVVQYRMNVWSRDIFDALERKDAGIVLYQSLIYVPLLAATLCTAVAGVYARMTLA